MQEFLYKIKDEIGIHARPAGLLVKEASKFSSTVQIENTATGKIADAKKLFSVMGLGVKCGNDVLITAEGDDETGAISDLKSFFEGNL